MASDYIIQSVIGTDGVAYKKDTDWTDNGDGTVSPVVGSALETWINGAGTATYQRTLCTTGGAAITRKYIIDRTNSGVRKITNPGDTWASGSSSNMHAPSLHIHEHLGDSQTTIRFEAWADDASAQALAVGDYVIARLSVTVTGAPNITDEWYGVITQRDPINSTRGKRRYSYIAADYFELLKTADVTGIPTAVRAQPITFPGDTGGPPMQTLGGPAWYSLNSLLADVVPDTLSYKLAAPDYMIERLPSNGNGLDLLAYALNSAGYYAFWDGPVLVIESHEHTQALPSLLLDDRQVFEVKREVSPAATEYDAVEVIRPQQYSDPIVQDQPPDYTLPPMGSTGAYPVPNEQHTEDRRSTGDLVIWKAQFTWEPPQQYIDQEPGPIMLGFSNNNYNPGTYSGQQIYHFITMFPGQVTVQPPTRYTDEQVDGPDGRDWYFLVQPNYIKVRNMNDYIDGWVVSKSGYYTTTGAVSMEQTPVGGATVILVGASSGVVYQTTTNADGYYRVDNAVPDDYSPHVYIAGDSYLANKHTAYTEGHPYDDDPYNDELGPDNSEFRSELWQLLPSNINLTVSYRTGRQPTEERTGGQTDYGNYEAYRGIGSSIYGDDTGNVLELDELNTLGIDTSNIMSELQALQLGEKLVDRSSETTTRTIITKPYGGKGTHVGRVIRLFTTTDDDIDEVSRIVSREIRVYQSGKVIEALSNDSAAFADSLKRKFATTGTVEAVNTVLQEKVRDILRRLQGIQGQTPTGDELRAGVL